MGNLPGRSQLFKSVKDNEHEVTTENRPEIPGWRKVKIERHRYPGMITEEEFLMKSGRVIKHRRFMDQPKSPGRNKPD